MRGRALSGFVVVAAVAVLSIVVQLPDSRGGAAPPAAAAPWVASWTAMPQLTEPRNMPPEQFVGEDAVLADTTLRQTLRTSIGGDSVRLRFSNAFGGSELPITSVSIALPAGGRAGASAIRPGTSREITFGGRSGSTIPVGAQAVSDPVRFPVGPAENVTVTVHLSEGQASTEITSHPGSRTTSHLLAGEHVDDAELPGATPVEHWYFLSGLEVRSPAPALAVLGDSLSDGRGSTTDGNDRWTDQLVDRTGGEFAVLNQAAGGNRVLHDGLGPNALARFDRDVLAQSGVRELIVFEGINDIGTAEPTAAAQRAVAEDLIGAYRQLIARAHAQRIEVCAATLTPIGGSSYDDPGGHREAARQRVNEWIRSSGEFDGVIDFDTAVRDPAAPRRLLPAADDGDHLHLNPEGYGMLAETVPAECAR